MNGDVSGARHLVLVGMMGTGKSTVGEILAARLGRAFCDSDAVIVEKVGLSVPEIFSERGEEDFRAEEAKVISDLLAGPGPAVISLGGGSVVDPATREILKHHTVVWMTADLDRLKERLKDGDGRPMLATGVGESLERLSRERAPLYAEVAQMCVDTTDRTPEEVAELIVEAL